MIPGARVWFRNPNYITCTNYIDLRIISRKMILENLKKASCLFTSVQMHLKRFIYYARSVVIP